MTTTGKCQSCRCCGSLGLSLFLAHPPAVHTMTELSSLNIERDLSPPIINLCLPPWALCPCSKVSHMQLHSCTCTHTHTLLHTFPLSCSQLKSFIVQLVEHEKKMSEMADLALGWVHLPRIAQSCPETTPPHWGSQEFTAGAEDIGQGRTGAARQMEFTAIQR